MNSITAICTLVTFQSYDSSYVTKDVFGESCNVSTVDTICIKGNEAYAVNTESLSTTEDSIYRTHSTKYLSLDEHKKVNTPVLVHSFPDDGIMF